MTTLTVLSCVRIINAWRHGPPCADFSHLRVALFTPPPQFPPAPTEVPAP